MEENVVMTLKGYKGDSVILYDDRLVISHRGVLNMLSMGIQGDKTIYYSEITAVQFKKASAFLNGFVQFSIKGGRENVSGLSGATSDENSIIISGNSQNVEAEKVFEFVNKKIAETRNQNNNVTVQSSGADELAKFKKLLDDGVISQDEFDAKKKQILGL